MNLIDIVLHSMRKQAAFLALLPNNTDWITFYEERTPAQKEECDRILQNCNHGCWQRMEAVCNATQHFVSDHMLFSRTDTPLSCFLPLVLALFNGVKRALTEDEGKFNRVLMEPQTK